MYSKSRTAWNRLLFLSITCLGISHIITQLTILRELLSIFHGNELTVGIILGNWMLLTGLGAYLGRFFGSRRLQLNVLVVFQVLAAVLPVACVYTLRVARDKLFIRGALLGITPIFFSTLVLLLPYCLITGMLLTLACSLFEFRNRARNIGTVYFLDNIGDIIGGSLFSFVLVYFFDSFRILYFPLVLNLLSAILLEVISRKRIFAVATAVLSACVLIFFVFHDLDDYSIRRLYEGQEVVFHKDSRYGKLVVTRLEDQYNFFENGSLLFSTDDIIRAEETVHYTMAQMDAPERVLVVSGGITGTAREILKYGVEQVDYVELDPDVIELGRTYTSSIDDERIRPIPMDGRLFIRTTNERYDAVILDLPDPSTIQTNRMYTVEFFQEVKSILRENGVISTSIASSANFPQSPEVAPLAQVLYSTLNEAFARIIIIPGDMSYFIASDGPLTYDVLRRIEDKGIPTEYVNKYYAAAVLTPDRIGAANEAARGGATVNTDFRPLICYYTIRYWIGQFETPVRIFVIIAAIALLAYMTTLRTVSFAVFTTGFAAAGIEITVIMGFQILYGYVYQRIGVIVTAFMVGLALGSFTINRTIARRNLGTLTGIQAGVAALSIVVPFVIIGIGRLGGPVSMVIGANVILPIMTMAAAFLVGFEFPLAAKLLKKDIPRTAGTLYCADLVGASAGAIAVSAALIPLIGLVHTCLLMGGLNTLSATLLLRKRTGNETAT
jgi:spermidine synthase